MFISQRGQSHTWAVLELRPIGRHPHFAIYFAVRERGGPSAGGIFQAPAVNGFGTALAWLSRRLI